MDIINDIKNKAKANFREVQAIRHHLHQFPELSFEEENTASFVQKKLDEYGISYQKNVAGHGIIALIKGNNPSKKVIALRADLDALPIEEKNEVPYKSKNNGVMHACGHDVHTACLLGAAKILNSLQKEFE